MKDLHIKQTHVLSEDGMTWIMKEEYAIQYRRTVKEQADNWVKGIAQHNTYADECCPDMSCCGREMWPKEKRELFVTLSPENQTALLLGVLNDFIPDDTYVAGLTPSNETLH